MHGRVAHSACHYNGSGSGVALFISYIMHFVSFIVHRGIEVFAYEHIHL